MKSRLERTVLLKYLSATAVGMIGSSLWSRPPQVRGRRRSWPADSSLRGRPHATSPSLGAAAADTHTIGSSVLTQFRAATLTDSPLRRNKHHRTEDTGAPESAVSSGPRICVVGSGTRFLSGISYYTYYLTDALSDAYDVSVILMRRLLPRRLYPGHKRVGDSITELTASAIAPTFDGVDWFALPSLIQGGRFLQDQNPDVVIFQWWTGTVLHSFLYLARIAKRSGAKIVLEFHESQDPGEEGIPLVKYLVKPGLQKLINEADHYVVHSEWDRNRLCTAFRLDPTIVTVIPHGPYPLEDTAEKANTRLRNTRCAQSIESDQCVTILFFGTIRPYKGLEDLVEAFDALPRAKGTHWDLLIVGETWENWTLPAEKVQRSPFSEDIEFVNRYVTDAELAGYLDRADLVALPYLRSSASGPLHIAMQKGIPVIVTDVGGLSEAAAEYSGTVFVLPADPLALAAGIEASLPLLSKHHTDVHSWSESRDRYSEVVNALIPG
jgi:glycosyltransferase involved in cell wall biosynthesis